MNDIGNVLPSQNYTSHSFNQYTTTELEKAQGIASVLMKQTSTLDEQDKHLTAAVLTEKWDLEEKTTAQLLDDWFGMIVQDRRERRFAKKASVEQWVLDHLKDGKQINTEDQSPQL
jgi:hypothetical protein